MSTSQPIDLTGARIAVKLSAMVAVGAESPLARQRWNRLWYAPFKLENCSRQHYKPPGAVATTFPTVMQPLSCAKLFLENLQILSFVVLAPTTKFSACLQEKYMVEKKRSGYGKRYLIKQMEILMAG